MSHSYPSGISREQFARILPTLESARHQVPDTRVDRHATDHQPPGHPPPCPAGLRSRPSRALR